MFICHLFIIFLKKPVLALSCHTDHKKIIWKVETTILQVDIIFWQIDILTSDKLT